MQTMSSQSKSSGAVFITILVLFLTACGGGGGGGGGGGTQSADQVSGNQQPIAAGTQESTTRESATSADSTQSSDTSTGSFSLGWTAPVSRTDGSPISLSEISGFTVYYGKSPGNYSNFVDVSDGTAQGVTLTKVPVGTYYVVMTTYDNGGRESGYSPVITKTIL